MTALTFPGPAGPLPQTPGLGGGGAGSGGGEPSGGDAVPGFVNPMLRFVIPEQMTVENVLLIGGLMWSGGMQSADGSHYTIGAFNGVDPMIFASVEEHPQIEPWPVAAKDVWFSRFFLEVVDLDTFEIRQINTPRLWFAGPDNPGDGGAVVRPHYVPVAGWTDKITPTDEATTTPVYPSGTLFIDASGATQPVWVNLADDENGFATRWWRVVRLDDNAEATVGFQSTAIDNVANPTIGPKSSWYVVHDGDQMVRVS